MLNEKVIGEYAYLLSDKQKVGSGQFGQVFKGYHEITKKKQVKGVFEQMLRNEIQILRQLNHQYILKMYADYETVNNFYIVTEYCETDILQILKHQGQIPEDQVIMYVLQIAEALLYLKQKQIIHRDIKPSNILIHNGEVRLADFGFAIFQDGLKYEDSKLQVGSPLYMSPETLLKQDYNHKTDIWSLGILYFEMIFGVVPFFSMEMEGLIRKLKQYQQDQVLVFKHPISIGSTEAIRNLLAYDPSYRCELIQLAEILQRHLRNRKTMTNSAHSDKRHKTPEIKRRVTPEPSPLIENKILIGSKDLVKINTSFAQKPNKQQASYFNKNNSSDSKQIEDKFNKGSFLRLKQSGIDQKNQINVKNMNSEDFLSFFITKLENLKKIQYQEGFNQNLSECQFLIYQYFGKDEKKLNLMKEKLFKL